MSRRPRNRRGPGLAKASPPGSAARASAFSRQPALSTYRTAISLQCWNNLPILNEWHRLYPDRDPVAVHEAVWGERLVCPAGGNYVWNPKWRTMESTVLGHPGEPKPGPDTIGPLRDLKSADFGISFQDGGLRATVEIERPTLP